MFIFFQYGCLLEINDRMQNKKKYTSTHHKAMKREDKSALNH